MIFSRKSIGGFTVLAAFAVSSYGCPSTSTGRTECGQAFRVMLADGSEAEGEWLRCDIESGRHPALILWFDESRAATGPVERDPWLRDLAAWSKEGRSLIFVEGRSVDPTAIDEDARALWAAMIEDPRVDPGRSRLLITFIDGALPDLPYVLARPDDLRNLREVRWE